ncbi:MAG: hypothetical protein M5U01_04390 [Ardenticatenaceae bacterium]|nr:hypothetical protein [Ardenticatenaceae bacterium]HBY97143.1 hypothetical protein [Chloroflexota bacterium]
MNSPEWLDDRDDLDALLHQTLRSAYGQAEPSPTLWPRLAARLNAPAPQRHLHISANSFFLALTTVVALVVGLLSPAPAVTVATLKLAPRAPAVSFTAPSMSPRLQRLLEAEHLARHGELALSAPARGTLAPSQTDRNARIEKHSLPR